MSDTSVNMSLQVQATANAFKHMMIAYNLLKEMSMLSPCVCMFKNVIPCTSVAGFELANIGKHMCERNE